MSKLGLGLIFAVATAFMMPASSGAKSPPSGSKAAAGDKAEKTESASPPLDKDAQQKLKEHLRLRNHIVKNVKYPATKESLLSSFKTPRDIKADDKKWLEETLPTRTYDSSDEVVKALGWEAAPTTTAKEGK
jgi:hypothetical protein